MLTAKFLTFSSRVGGGVWVGGDGGRRGVGYFVQYTGKSSCWIIPTVAVTNKICESLVTQLRALSCGDENLRFKQIIHQNRTQNTVKKIDPHCPHMPAACLTGFSPAFLCGSSPWNSLLLSVQPPCISVHALRMLKIPNTGIHAVVWTQENTAHTDRNR